MTNNHMGNYVGQRVKRTEDPRLIKGLAHYVDDISLPGTLHVAFVRSYLAHAKINSIDTSAAESAPGVIAVYTGKDVAEKVGPVPCAGALPDLKVPDHRVLATNKVYFVGHPVAAVVATDRYTARDAADLIIVDYEDLPVVTDVEQAAAGGPVIHLSTDFRRRRHRRCIFSGGSHCQTAHTSQATRADRDGAARRARSLFPG
jgi:carbon-monoxide dehydrogenase large subunit